MRLRTYLWAANGFSTGFIILFLFFSYWRMYLSFDVMLWLSAVTIVAASLSTVIYYLATQPILRSIRDIATQTKRISDGLLGTKAVPTGPREIRELAHQFNDMSEKLQESFERLRNMEKARRQLVENVSHDLRTPLASIRSYAEALQDKVVDDEETLRLYLATIKQETDRLSGLIDDLFQLSRLQAGAEAFEPISCHPDDLILDILQSLSLQLEKKQIMLKTDIPDRLPMVQAVPSQIKRVLGNLLQNAIRHSPVGGHMLLEVTMEGETAIRISVTDQGEGIALEEQSRIFERFYRTDKSRSREKGGAGLGLAIAQSLVELHGGKIGVESVLGSGSRFWFTIPCVKSP